MPETPCDVHTEQIRSLYDSDQKQWSKIDGIEKALAKLIPIWVSLVLTLAGFVTGSALTFAGMVIKFAGNG